MRWIKLIELIAWSLWIIFTQVILGKGMRMMVMAVSELAIFWYAGDKILTTTGTEKAVYLLMIQLGILGAWWHINVVEKDRPECK